MEKSKKAKNVGGDCINDIQKQMMLTDNMDIDADTNVAHHNGYYTVEAVEGLRFRVRVHLSYTLGIF